nr:restriction endonuclease subunit S [Catenibacterium mitsuokai]
MKGVNKENIKKHALNEFLSEYKELNTDNKYRPVAVGRYGIRKRESIYSKELAKDYSKNKLIHKDTLTVGMGSKQIDIGILIEDETFAVSPAYHTYKIQGIRCKYLEYCLQSKNIEMFSLYAKRGSRQGKSIDLKRWLTYKIPVYSEEDQIVIEENLNKINVVIELRRKQLELLDELVRARFVEMFGDPIENQKDWEVVKIRDIVTDVRYGTSKPAVEGGRYPYLRMNNLTVDGDLDLNDLKYIDIPDNEIEKCVVRKGDILFNRTNSIDLIGKTAVFNLLDDMVIAGYIIRIRLNNQILPDVFSQYMNLEAMKKVLRGMAKGAVNQANINAQELQSIKVYIPNMELQKQYVEFKEEIDKSRLRELLAIKQIKLLLHDSWFLFY